MNKNISTNFLLLKDNEQKQIIQYLSKDFRRKEIYNHFLQLYKLKMQYLKKCKKRLIFSKKEKKYP